MKKIKLSCPKCKSEHLILKSQGYRECLNCKHIWNVIAVKLFPSIPSQLLNSLLVSRVFPDVSGSIFTICVKEIIRKEGLSVTEAVARLQQYLSITIDGEARIDELYT
jgi:hypothetical protein